MVNPRAGREAETEITPTESAKKILVIGAGPAGCSFAVTAAERGHKVTICEKEQQIGGQVHWFAPSTRKHDFPFLIDYFKAMLDKHGVEVRTGTEVTSELIAREKPDLVIVATGAAPFRPPIDAVDAPQVFQAWDVLKGRVQTGHDVVVVGGGSVGLETAVYLASKGTISPEQLYFLVMHNAESPEVLRDLCLQGTKKVTVIEMLPKIGQDIGMSTRWVLMKDIKMRGIDVVTSARMKDIQPDSIVYTDAKGEDHIIRADNVILAMGSRPENTLSKALEQAGCNVVVIGDANKVGKISSAIDEGFDLGRKV